MRKALEAELCALSGDDWTVFQDVEHIDIGEQWRRRLEEGVGGSTFFLPILTPTYLKRPICRDELNQFLKKERELERDDLVFPLLYLDTPSLTDKHTQASDPLAIVLAARKWDDWRELRVYGLKTAKVRLRLSALSRAILSASSRNAPAISPRPLASGTLAPIATAAIPLLPRSWDQKVLSVVKIAWRIVPFTAMLSGWLREIQLHGLIATPDAAGDPFAKYGPRARDLMRELYSLIRAQKHSTTAIEWSDAFYGFRDELWSFEEAAFLKGRHMPRAPFGEGLRLSNAGFIIDLALLCDDPVKSIKLNEILEGSKERLNGGSLSDSIGLPLVVINAFFRQYEQKGQGITSKTIGESHYIPHDVA